MQNNIGEKPNYVDWVSGLKCILAVSVCLRHYVNGFLPALYTGNLADTKVFLRNGKSLEGYFNNSPLYFFVNGGFAVYGFWMLSAFLLAYHYFKGCGHASMQRKVVKKYAGLVIPVLITYFVVYILLKGNLFFNTSAADLTGSIWLSNFYTFQPQIKTLLWSAFIDTFFTSNVPYNAVLWTIKIEFFGSIAAMLLLELFGDLKKRWIIYIVLGVWLLAVFPIQYMCFLMGVVLADIFANKSYSFNDISSFILFAIGFLGGCFPSDFYPGWFIKSGFPTQLCLGNFWFDTRGMIYCISTTLIILSIMNNKKLTKLLESKILVGGEEYLSVYI